MDLSKKLKYTIGIIEAYNNLGDAYWYKSDYLKSQQYYFKAYKIADSIGYRKEIAHSLYNVGWIICLQQNNFNAINYLYNSLAIYTELNDVNGILQLHNALGNVYTSMYQFSKQKNHFDSSLKYLTRGIEIAKQYKATAPIGLYYGNIGTLMAYSGDYNSALFYANKYYDFYKNSSDSTAIMTIERDIASYQLELGNVDVAIELLHKVELKAQRLDNRELLKESYNYLHQGYKQKGKIDKAYLYFYKFFIIHDSISRLLNSSSMNDLKETFEVEKRDANIRELKQQNEIQELKTQKNRFALIGVGVVLVVIIIIAYLLYKRNEEKNSANLLLKEQNTIISQKKQEIESSIHYAKGIQTSFFPDVNELKSVFSDSFIFYRPKDVVSGDFYWFHKIENFFYCVAADCTGHGVPGALMSIVSVDKISQALFEKKLIEPAQILSHINVEIKKALKQHDDQSKQKDGLDIALLRFDLNTNKVVFSGANRPLFVISNGRINEYKADKVAIAGFTPDHYEFNQTSVQLNKGDSVYVFSDGYADQFGGTDGKKFMTKNFKSLLLNVAEKPMVEQEKQVLSAHYDWKGSYEQVDDILVIGIKI